jgi:hypothetical protein
LQLWWKLQTRRGQKNTDIDIINSATPNNTLWLSPVGYGIACRYGLIMAAGIVTKSKPWVSIGDKIELFSIRGKKTLR